MGSPAAQNSSRYFVPDPSVWPFVLTIGLVATIVGVSGYLENNHIGPLPIWLGVALSIFIIFRWFQGIARESEGGRYSAQVDRTYRWGMSWFIFSEVMFFAAFFGALFYARGMVMPWLSGEGAKLSTHLTLWPNFEGVWPSNGPANVGGEFKTIPAFDVPLLNTLILISSGVTITMAHHALKEGKRGLCILWMWATVALGCSFLYFQAEEYMHAYHELNLTLGSGIYGSTFFMLTGFHGMHVTLGTIMLTVITLRLMKGHFKPDSHFGFEGVAWYWHFVDVVWIGLFIVVYWL
ncbi:cytochrome c oxidase subunit 3 [Sinimarinibacterium sp. CAU 1509]|uniref:cytochrome c oxidase subunit 3 n=1 Tax=Sinimarinibacterium sp. CAU 1509 TaxID=2562283 RepID=UPI0010AD396D|nr:cytochrome c oxidase subunit 3 [Sinimarinibacterium sp. CAU 1509]TJY58957.1 cytochrome c oxidase subunit 3 [Sinimarinibacterium sp. CAU 1509]